MASLDSKIKIILFIFLLFRALGRGLFFIIDSQENFNRLIAVITLPILLLGFYAGTAEISVTPVLARQPEHPGQQ